MIAALLALMGVSLTKYDFLILLLYVIYCLNKKSLSLSLTAYTDLPKVSPLTITADAPIYTITRQCYMFPIHFNSSVWHTFFLDF